MEVPPNEDNVKKVVEEIDDNVKTFLEKVEVFDSIWNEKYGEDQKEQFEVAMRNEIKKLIRYRDQIKTVMQSANLEDKQFKALMDAREQIKLEMERFETIEKEAKAEVFSKGGTGQRRSIVGLGLLFGCFCLIVSFFMSR